jgi:DNA-binding SARP family transcriptional activator
VPFIAKLLAPIASMLIAVPRAVDDAAAGGVTLFVAPSDYVLPEGFASALARRGRSALWLRLGPEDRDPASLLLSIIEGMGHQCPGFGKATLELMRRQPGPIAGWTPLFASLADELAGNPGSPGAIVLDGVHHLAGSHATLRLLGTHLLRARDPAPGWLLISRSDLPGAMLPAGIRRRSAGDLRIGADNASRLVERTVPGLTGAYIRRAVKLCDERAVLLDALCAAADALGPAIVQQTTSMVGQPTQVLDFLARAWLATIDHHAQQALALALRLEYSHPALTRAAIGRDTLPPGPWLEMLEAGWSRIRAPWREPLRRTLPRRAMPDRDSMHRAAGHLLSQGADEKAIPLYLELDDWSCAVRAIGAVADRLMDLGRWQTLRAWLDRMPDSVVKQQPWLVYDRAEIAMADGSVEDARRDFSTAEARFTASDEPAGACHSMLAESVLAAGQRDFARAQARALAADAVARASGLIWHRVWASWQLGTLASIAGEFDNALAYFGQAVSMAARTDDQVIIDLVQRAEEFTRRLRELFRQRELHRQAFLTLEGAVQEAAERLADLLFLPPGNLEDLVGAYGWLHTPMVLKLPAATPLLSDAGSPDGPGFWSKALRALGLHHEYVHPPRQPDGDGGQFTEAADGQAASATSARPPAEASLWPVRAVQGPMLTVHLFGQMRVMVDHALVDGLSSGPGRRVFKYLLTHRNPSATQEVLMDVFWPDSTPEAARNSLRVAVHRLRRSLREVTDTEIIVFQNDAYRLHSDVRMWLDRDEFERHIESGRQLEAVGDLVAAMTAYEMAVALYQGDFMADDPYEEWAVHSRERLRLAYLDTLDRLSHLYFGRGRYAACAALCQRIIERDACREDAHRRLMRCHNRQGQPHLALRQYQLCAEALRRELGVDPSPATSVLDERIRRREPL